VLLFHDRGHGEQLINALGRHGAGLPANVLPVAVNEVTEIGLETLAAAVAYGVVAIQFLLKAKPKHSPEGLIRNISYADAIFAGLGYGSGLAHIIETDDPDALAEAVRKPARSRLTKPPSDFMPLGSGRGLLKLAIGELREAAPEAKPIIPLPPRAPFGGLRVATEGCTLCLACVSACPTAALSANPESPMLRFAEDLCVQCGLCQATCPEKVIALEPRLNFEAWTAPPVVIKQEEPFHCVECGKPFGVKSTIERITAKLEGQHWMYSGGECRPAGRLEMCEDCRVVSVVKEGFDPKSKPRPAPRTSEDYFRERLKRANDQLILSGDCRLSLS